MPREIKFRGKRKDNGEWVCGYYVKSKSKTHNTTGHFIYTENTDTESIAALDFHKVYPDTVGQFTGFKDKNGEKVYYNDYYLDYGQKGRVTRLVVAQWLIDENKMNEPMSEVEVIDNIHENPELLEKTE